MPFAYPSMGISIPMIVILHENRQLTECEAMADAIQKSYPGLPILLLPSESTTAWPSPETWSDVLVVPFDGGSVSPGLHTFVASLRSRQARPFILPVAMNDAHRVPPVPVNHIKALPYEGGSFDRGCRRIGARIGLALRSRDHLVFISYRAVDGVCLAIQFEEFLRKEGYAVWRDDSKDPIDGQTMIPPGDEAQERIEKDLKRADMVLLLDTPRAAESAWIDLEMQCANGNLIPVLPVLFRLPGEKVACSRFRTLDSLQRSAVVNLPDNTVPQCVSSDILEMVLREMETYLCEIVQRRLKIPHIVRQRFLAESYDWTERDRFIYESIRRAGRLATRVFSHCSIFEGIYDPALSAFVQHFQKFTPRANYALFVYDGAVIPTVQIQHIQRAARLEDSTDIILLHHDEVPNLLRSNFTKL